MITSPTPSHCFECPFARHLDRNRFSCGNSLTKVVKSNYSAIPECNDAVINRHFKGLDLEWIANHIQLTLNWLNIDVDWVIPDGENFIEVNLDSLSIGYIKQSNHQYYSDRLVGLKSLNPYEIALHMVNSHYLDGVVDEILINRALAIDYM